MEPWLDSLSEDWCSEKRSSSPAPSNASRRITSGRTSTRSNSQIPHLSQSLRKEKNNGSFLRHRSSRGQEREKSQAVLTERSASSLNLPPPPQTESLKRSTNHIGSRRVSSAFSESQNSVQHYTVDERVKSNAYTPEWKKRLERQGVEKNDSVDLFAPSQLEGIFAHPANHTSNKNNKDPETRPQPWKSLKITGPHTATLQNQSFRASRNRPTEMAVLEEVNEDEGYPFDAEGTAENVVPPGSLRGIVRDRVQSIEEASFRDSTRSLPADLSFQRTSMRRSVTDPRWRTISGQAELRNEYISPVTVSKQNSIREKVMSESLDFNVEELQERLSAARINHDHRPSSSSSDRDISYMPGGNIHKVHGEDSILDLTSQSLPEDLSTGTEDFVSHGGYINSRRGGYSNEASFLHRPLSPTPETPQRRLPAKPMIQIQSSPPPFRPTESHHNQTGLSASVPTTPKDNSVVHHETPVRPVSSTSPLKLFGLRDTYTNNKLMRILSHFEDPDDKPKVVKPDLAEQKQDQDFRMSQFGEGDLDGFTFEQEIILPEISKDISSKTIEKVIISTSVTSPEAPKSKSTIQTDVTVAFNANASITASSMDRTTKRRRTLVDGTSEFDLAQSVGLDEKLLNAYQTAGKKRKDAKSGVDGVPADAHVLASRTLLEPKLVHRRSGSLEHMTGRTSRDEQIKLPPIQEDLTEALAAELASFAQEVVEVQNDSRKPSLATKDYMEEANKVMQFIRERGKPKTSLPEIKEPTDTFRTEIDSMLDLDVNDESTKDEFSRPPSREGKSKDPVDRRRSKHDSKTADYLRQYEDQEDRDLLNSASVLGTLHLDNPLASCKNITDHDDEQRSDPPNIRISNLNETQRKRKYSTSTIDGTMVETEIKTFPTGSSSESSTRRTFPTGSSSSTGQKGVIASGTIVIPDQVGIMVFDHHRKMWVKKPTGSSPVSGKQKNARQTNSEEDPFKDIPDLSIDDGHELENDSQAKHVNRGQSSRFLANNAAIKRAAQSTKHPLHQEILPEALIQAPEDLAQPVHEDGIIHDHQGSIKSNLSKHEARLHNGMPSEPPTEAESPKKQARVVTIAFSSPVVSRVKYNEEPSISDMELDEEDSLPLDDSGMMSTPPKSARKVTSSTEFQVNHPILISNTEHEKHRNMTLTRNPSSRIDESDKGEPNVEMSLVHVRNPDALAVRFQEDTPVKSLQVAKAGNSMICLTPLSEFTLHQIDNARHQDESFVESRVGPQALRHAHGSLALTVDALVQAITDAIPTESYWDQTRCLHLSKKNLLTMHGLKDYCSTLEELDAGFNQITELAGLPPSLRSLYIPDNLVTNLTSWNHLHNLQYVDVSSNQLDNLDAFSSLVHLRHLKANDNHIRDIEGVLDLNGLIELEIRGNELVEVDFEAVDLSRLRKLDMSKNKLLAVRNLQYLPELEELNISQNNLESFQVATGFVMCKIKTLDVSHNALTLFGFGQFPGLQSLNLDSNNLTQLEGLEQAAILQNISLQHQNVSTDIVSQVLRTPNDCHTIRLSWNALSEGSPTLPSVPQYSLRHLEIAGCGAAELPAGFGDSFPNCRVLDLNYNALKSLSSLQGMTRLAHLTVKQNRIQRLRRTCLTMSRFPHLSQVDLRDNPLTVGLYPPLDQCNGLKSGPESYVSISDENDARWVTIMDETTQMKRNTMRLLLAQGCKNLQELDGRAFNRQQVLQQGQMLDVLRAKGVLAIPTTPLTVDRLEDTEVGIPANDDQHEGFVVVENNTDQGDEQVVDF